MVSISAIMGIIGGRYWHMENKGNDLTGEESIVNIILPKSSDREWQIQTAVTGIIIQSAEKLLRLSGYYIARYY